MKKIYLTIILIVFSSGLYAQEQYLKDVKETQDFSIKIATLFKENKISESFEELIKFWPLPQNELESLENHTIKYLNVVEQRIGKPTGILKSNTETISDIAIRETYIVKYSISAIRLIFTYYRNNNGWIINAFKWDDSFTEEFK